MRIETDLFIVESTEEIPKINELLDYLNTRIDEILDFFELKSINKKRIIFWNNLDEYIKHLSKYTKYEDGMCADTFDKNINILSLNEAHKTETHKNMTFKSFEENATHEFVHVCQQELEQESSKTNNWFYEALATNLGNSEQFEKLCEIDIERDKLENFNSMGNSRYEIAYTLGRYLLENYSKEEILKFVKYPSLLDKETDKILSNAREWTKRQTNEKRCS